MGAALFAAWTLWRAQAGPAASRADASATEMFRRASAEALARHPPVEVNAAAKTLEELAAALGADLAPPLPGRAHPSLAEGDRLAKAGLSTYLIRHAESPDETVEAPPLTVAAYLSDHARDVDLLADALLNGDMPTWEFVVPRHADTPEPSYLGHLAAQRVLLCRALAEIEQRRYPQAAGFLEASWRLKEATAVRPLIIWQILAIATARWEAGVLRKMPTSDPGWRERLTFRGQRERVLTAIRDEGLLTDHSGRETEASAIEAAVYLVGFQRLTDALDTMDPCTLTRENSERAWQSLFVDPTEKVLAGIIMPNLASAVHRSYLLQLEGELTAKVLELRASNGDTFEPESAVCSGARWSTYRLPDGSSHLRFAGRYEDWDEGGLKPPLEFTIRAAGGASRP